MAEPFRLVSLRKIAVGQCLASPSMFVSDASMTMNSVPGLTRVTSQPPQAEEKKKQVRVVPAGAAAAAAKQTAMAPPCRIRPARRRGASAELQPRQSVSLDRAEVLRGRIEPRRKPHHGRLRGALGAVVDLQCKAEAPIGEGAAVETLGASLTSTWPGTRCMISVTGWRVAATRSGMANSRGCADRRRHARAPMPAPVASWARRGRGRRAYGPGGPQQLIDAQRVRSERAARSCP